MSRPDPIEYAERLYTAIRDANFSPISFLAFGNAVKDGLPMRGMLRIAVEPFMRVVGEMLDLEEVADGSVTDAEIVAQRLPGPSSDPAGIAGAHAERGPETPPAPMGDDSASAPTDRPSRINRRRSGQ
jgi:hypothetical protein